MSLFTFGPGTLWGIRQDVANSTPVKFGGFQGVDINLEASNKELYGQYQFPLAVARGTGKISGKIKAAGIQGRIFSDLYFGVALSSGQTTTANGEAATIPSASSYTVTVANAATFVADLGVVAADTGLPLVKVSSAPATGQYSVDAATGTYTFAAADQGKAVLISYTYTVAATGQSLIYSNQLLGVSPVFRLVLESQWASPEGIKKAVVTLLACTASKLSFSTKQEDFMIPEMDFSAFANSAGQIMSISMNEVS